MVRVGGKPWLGVGFYYDGVIVPDAKPAVPMVMESKKVFADLARQGMTQIMPYGMDVLGDADLGELVGYLDDDLGAKLKFDMPLVRFVAAILNTTAGMQTRACKTASSCEASLIPVACRRVRPMAHTNGGANAIDLTATDPVLNGASFMIFLFRFLFQQARLLSTRRGPRWSAPSTRSNEHRAGDPRCVIPLCSFARFTYAPACGPCVREAKRTKPS